jgi:ariadne-1
MSDEDWSESSDSDHYQEETKEPIRRALSYELLNETSIRSKEASSIRHVADSTGLSEYQAELLLVRYNWDARLVCQRVGDGRGTDDILMSTPERSRGPVTCEMCYCEYGPEQLKGLSCRHFFCNDCYSEYLTVALAEKGLTSLFTTCPTKGCPAIVNGALYKALLPLQGYEKHRELLVRSYVENRPSTKYCPAPDCTSGVDYPKTLARSIVCDCGFVWCFQCSAEGHQPITCEALATWIDKFGTEGPLSSDTWIKLFTKPCPKCKKTIEKNQGCMHMTCPCGHEFCWLCFGNWGTHGASSGNTRCNKFNEELKSGSQDKHQTDIVTALKKTNEANHYSDRFNDHKRSVKFAQEKLTRVKTEIAEMMRELPSINPREFDYLVESIRLVIEARSVVAYSYPLGYFMSNPHKLVFYEFIQGELEHSLDNLDERTEGSLMSYLEVTHGIKSLNHDFYLSKSSVLSLIDTVRGHLNECVRQMETGFPDINIQRTEAELHAEERKKIGNWICTYCLQTNGTELELCGYCNYRNRLLDPTPPKPKPKPKQTTEAVPTTVRAKRGGAKAAIRKRAVRGRK